MTGDTLRAGLSRVSRALQDARQPFALAGGMAIAIRGEPRFTRDIDLVVVAPGDREMEALVFELRGAGYEVVALVEHEARGRLATARLATSGGLVVDLIAASCGIEAEIVDRATAVAIPGIGDIPVARAEELLAMKILAMTDRRPQDRIDAVSLLLVSSTLDLDAVREDLRLIRARGFHREQDLLAKLDLVLADVRGG